MQKSRVLGHESHFEMTASGRYASAAASEGVTFIQENRAWQPWLQLLHLHLF